MRRNECKHVSRRTSMLCTWIVKESVNYKMQVICNDCEERLHTYTVSGNRTKSKSTKKLDE